MHGLRFFLVVPVFALTLSVTLSFIEPCHAAASANPNALAQNKPARELSNTDVLQLYRQVAQLEVSPNKMPAAATLGSSKSNLTKSQAADAVQSNLEDHSSNQASFQQSRAHQATLAIQKLYAAAAQGHVLAQLSLGNLYLSGLGVPQDQKQAFKWIKAAAKQGNAQAQNNLGVMYDKGEGVSKDAKKAYAWYKQAAAQDFAQAQFNLGLLYEQGRGVAQDLIMAATWFSKAATQGHPEAQLKLGALYEQGRGVPQNLFLAARWYAAAMESHNINAFLLLMQLYQNHTLPQLEQSLLTFTNSANSQQDGQEEKTAGQPALVAHLSDTHAYEVATRTYSKQQVSSEQQLYFEPLELQQSIQSQPNTELLSTQLQLVQEQQNYATQYDTADLIDTVSSDTASDLALQSSSAHTLQQPAADHEQFIKAQLYKWLSIILAVVVVALVFIVLWLFKARSKALNNSQSATAPAPSAQLSFKWYEAAAENGSARAQNNLGVIYKEGRGTTQDYEQAVKWFSAAAEQGNAIAQKNLGFSLIEGQGIAQDYTAAFKWLTAAASQNNAQAQNGLGDMYNYGLGVETNFSKAVSWYRCAAKQGNAEAQFNLGLKYEMGQGLSRNFYQAVKWYTMAAEQGHANAQFYLGMKYKNGQGVSSNQQEAIRWLQEAAAHGHALAQASLQELLNQQTDDNPF